MGILKVPLGEKTINKMHVKPSSFHNYEPQCHDRVANVITRSIFGVIFYYAFLLYSRARNRDIQNYIPENTQYREEPLIRGPFIKLFANTWNSTK